MSTSATPFLMFNDQLDAALELYTTIFADAKVLSRQTAGPGGPVTSAEFTVGGQRFMAFNGGAHFRFSDAFSIFVRCADQAEVDRYWDALVRAGATPVRCGWITDPFGLSWQIIPARFIELVADPNPAKSRAVFEAMMTMQKLDVAALERAHARA